MKLLPLVTVMACGIFVGCSDAAKPTIAQPKSEPVTRTQLSETAVSVPPTDEKTGMISPLDGRELTASDLKKINKENFLKITIGMPKVDVHLILGKPFNGLKDSSFNYEREDWIDGEKCTIKIFYHEGTSGAVVSSKEQKNL